MMLPLGSIALPSCTTTVSPTDRANLDNGGDVSPSEFGIYMKGAIFTAFDTDRDAKVTRVDPDTMEKTEIVIPSGAYGALGAGTIAIEMGERLWVGSCGSDRLSIFDFHQ
mgnify:FL=1